MYLEAISKLRHPMRVLWIFSSALLHRVYTITSLDPCFYIFGVTILHLCKKHGEHEAMHVRSSQFIPNLRYLVLVFGRDPKSSNDCVTIIGL
ncbi:hypothetical protein F5Y11DRAFT_328833 [Daldinia sp. FL1419]|nr:hypothetical protein F5Y11DRAFT_328833 [Daldinia sp. FL1419]